MFLPMNAKHGQRVAHVFEARCRRQIQTSMSSHTYGTNVGPSSQHTPYPTQYSYQPQASYAQYPPYSQGYGQNTAGYTYQYYPQSQSSPSYAAPKSLLPTLSLSHSAPSSSQQVISQLQTHATAAPATRAPKKPQSLKGTFNKECMLSFFSNLTLIYLFVSEKYDVCFWGCQRACE